MLTSTFTSRAFGEKYGYHGGEEFKIERVPKAADPDTPPPQIRTATLFLNSPPQSPIVDLTVRRTSFKGSNHPVGDSPFCSPDINPEILFSAATSLLRPVSRTT